MEVPLLQDIIIILGLSVVIILLFQMLRLPSVLGLLLTGIISGPHGLSLIEATHEVELLAEIGVIFLLFVIGIEFSLDSLSKIKYTVLGAGSLQVFGTIGLTATLCYIMGLPGKEGIFMGFLLSLSSTAIVLKMLQERGETTAPHGRMSVAVLIFQDIIVVPMMLISPLMGGKGGDLQSTILWLVVKIAAIIGVVIVLSRYVVPVILNQVVKTKSRELFILTTIVICFSTAWLTSSVGLSLALGAFFAGLIISESDYSHQATANILPFREIFISFFFVSIGMLLNLNFFIQHMGTIFLLTLAAILVKVLILIVTVLVMSYPPRTVFITALSLFQVGEFAFVLSVTGLENNLMSEEVYQYFLAISIITMAITPFAIKYSSQITDYILRLSLPQRVRKRLKSMSRGRTGTESIKEEVTGHLVIIGHGLNGENVAKAARQAKIPYQIIELDPHIFKTIKERNEPVVFGDASDETILKHVAIQNARVVVVAISDPAATKNIIRRVREFTRTAHIIVRTRYLKEIEDNLKLGANEVIPEEFGTSIEIFSRVLKRYLVPEDEIQEFIGQIRSHNYEMLREVHAMTDSSFSPPLHLSDMEIAALPVEQGRNSIVGKTIMDSGLRSNHGVTVLAIKRGSRYLTEIAANDEIKQDDVLYVFGSAQNIARLNKYLEL
ncbi:monovalent cation:proton antiporter family protein [Pedobacter sp. SYSU D00535]|uniref:monovalent cation:proton antiporter family protein n=1 Tax=Pedobacter sp. SYSU D00535 TaxID=2810308 RepID=UPI001A958047|nr:monovalent cation:proton antiporter family protein [Pedobacter sp. SYSU D00535]